MKIHRLLAGNDGPGRRALPVGEFLHPLPLLAVAVLLVNDHLLKGADVIPSLVTGKLSDIAGLLFFPLLCTTAVDLVLLAAFRLGAAVDFSLRRYKLAMTTIATAVLFSTIKLSVAAADSIAGLLSAVGLPSHIVADPTDLVALPMLAVSYWLGTREIARVPLGRLEVIEHRWKEHETPVAAGLNDVARLWRKHRAEGESAVATLVDGFERYLETGDGEAAESALRFCRDPRESRDRRP